MRLFLSALAVSLGLSLAAEAQNAEIEANISAQIEAFKSDDLDTAFSYASPNIRQIFRTPENFGAMVRGGYPMVWRPGTVRFLELREIAGRLWQKVLITDPQGAVHILDYQMIELDSGWKINGVQILQAPKASA